MEYLLFWVYHIGMGERRAIELLEEWLDSYLNFEQTPKKNIFWLETIRFLCNRFGNPQESFKSFHVAGSKGKGSVSAFLSSILDEAGYPCGLYTSPHILDLSERISLAHGPLQEKVYENALRLMACRVDSVIPEQYPSEREPTWFELMTLYAFLCFREAGLPWAVFETGLGGRLDSTNVLLPEVSVLTPIELEHTEYLGNTITAIAGEKAGIIKKGIPVCSAAQKKEAEDVFRAKALEMGSPILFVNEVLEDVTYSLEKDESGVFFMNTKLTFNRFFRRPLSMKLKLLGRVQAENAALASLVIKQVFPDIDESVIERGLEKARLPARCEIVANPYDESGKSMLVLDGAHTVNSLAGILDTFGKITENRHDAHLLFACASDKDMAHMVKLLLPENPLFEDIILTKPGDKKHSDLDSLEAAFMKQKNEHKAEQAVHYSIERDFQTGIKKALQTAAEKHVPILVTGSFYLVREVKLSFMK